MVTPIRILALDIDGVVTDGTVKISATGEEEKAIAFQDVDAVTAAVRAGFKVAFITGEKDAMVGRIASRFGVAEVVCGAKDKLGAVRRLSRRFKLPLKSFCYVGDADRDAPALAAVGLGLAPANARPAAKAAADRVLINKGGQGAIAEAVSIVLARQAPRPAVRREARRIDRIVQNLLDAERDLLRANSLELSRIAELIRGTLRAGGKIVFRASRGLEGRGREFMDRLGGVIQPEAGAGSILFLSSWGGGSGGGRNRFTSADRMNDLIGLKDLVIALAGEGLEQETWAALAEARKNGARTVLFYNGGSEAVGSAADVILGAAADTSFQDPIIQRQAWEAICRSIRDEEGRR